MSKAIAGSYEQGLEPKSVRIDAHGIVHLVSEGRSASPSAGGKLSESHHMGNGYYRNRSTRVVESENKDSHYNENRPRITANITMATVPLASHPKIGELMKKYDGRWDREQQRFVWGETFAGSGRSGFTKDGKFIKDINPMYGVQSYLEPRCRVQETRVGGATPRVGTLKDPTYLFGGKSGHWMVTAVTVERTYGNGQRQVTVEYEYAPHGWNKLLYGDESMGGSGGSGGSGNITRSDRGGASEIPQSMGVGGGFSDIPQRL